MPANSGALTGTIAHKHSALSADGGFLDDGVTGVTGTANGSLLMFDGSSVAQDLPAGNLNDVLTMGAAVPAWTPAAGGSAGVELITSSTQAVSDPYFTLSFAPVLQSTAGKFFGVCTGAKTNTSNNVLMYINGLTTATYQYNWNEMDIGTLSSGYSTGSQWQVVRNYGAGSSTNFTIWFEIIFNTYADNIQFNTTSTTQDRGKTTSGTNTTAGQTSLSEVEFYQQNGGGNIEAGTFCAIYKTNL